MRDMPDPRIASATVTGGPADLIGHDLVIVDEFRYRGEVVHIPRPLAGVPEFVAVAEAEVKGDELREQMLSTLVDQPPAKWQPDTTLVVEMRAAAESAVITAVVGLEAFSNHHVLRLADPKTGKLLLADEQMTAAAIRELPLDERYKRTLPALLGVSNPAGKQWWQVLRRVQGLAALTRHAIHEPVERRGLSGERSLAERYYLGEYQGVTRMMFSVFEHFAPNWISDERLRRLGDGSGSIKQALEALAQERTNR
ncbi:MAG: hypothetical protein ABR583_06235 [Gaiellaceae bacterium]